MEEKRLCFGFGMSLRWGHLRRVGDGLGRVRVRNWSRTTTVARQDGARSVVFLGTPEVAARSLRMLSERFRQNGMCDIVAVVTQPPAPSGRKRQLASSPVHLAAGELGIDQIFTPTSCKEEDFLEAMERLQPDLCVTAAYGNVLPKRFLSIPKEGTLNIHPSLLPKFRGAAPVPRAIECGETETGVTVTFTVFKMDAGPIVTQRSISLRGEEKAPDVLSHLFEMGTEALLDVLPSVFSKTAVVIDQNESQATHAPKIKPEEARLTLTENAAIVHNRVRAFSGWPGTYLDVLIGEDPVSHRLKIITTRIARRDGGPALGVHEVKLNPDTGNLLFVCDDGSALDVEEVQPPGKKVMAAKAFWNGLRGKSLSRCRVPH